MKSHHRSRVIPRQQRLCRIKLPAKVQRRPQTNASVLVEAKVSRRLDVDDDVNGFEKAREIQDEYRKLGIKAHVEASRSDNSYHVWEFFAEPIPAEIARAIALHVLSTCGLKGLEVFPKQNRLTKWKPYGNFIYLPLQGKLAPQGRTAFLDESGKPYPDQWGFLASVRRHAAEEVKVVFEGLPKPTKVKAGSQPCKEQKQTTEAINVTGELPDRFITLLSCDPLIQNLWRSNPRKTGKKGTERSCRDWALGRACIRNSTTMRNVGNNVHVSNQKVSLQDLSPGFILSLGFRFCSFVGVGLLPKPVDMAVHCHSWGKPCAGSSGLYDVAWINAGTRYATMRCFFSERQRSMKILDLFAHYYAGYGYWIIFVSLLWDNTIILGYVMPAEVLVVMGGFFARQGKLSLSGLAIVGWFGMMIGQSVAYSIGAYGFVSLVQKLRLTHQVEKAQAHFARYRMLAVLLATFTGTTRTILSVAIVFSHTPYRRFVVW